MKVAIESPGESVRGDTPGGMILKDYGRILPSSGAAPWRPEEAPIGGASTSGYGVPVQEHGEHATDQVRRSGHRQWTAVAASELLGLIGERARLIQEIATVAERLLTLAADDDPTTDAIKQLESKLPFEIPDLAGQRRLSDAQALRRLRDKYEKSDNSGLAQKTEAT
jgi:hypothetical protein